MKIVPRILQTEIEQRLQPGKVMMLLGARRVGKTVLIKEIESGFNGKTLFLNGDDSDAATMIEERSIANYQRIFNGIDFLIIDEAQNIPDIGEKLKLIADHIDGLHILVSGSSSFDLQNKAGQPLVGRSSTFHLFPFSQEELLNYENALQTKQNLELRLIYGSYPELNALKTLEEKREYLKEISNAYLLKDILSFGGIRNAKKMQDLLSMIAFQAGSEVSLDELGSGLSISKNTVASYLDLLSKVFVIYPLRGFSRNLRKEMNKKNKWFFYDNGIRNALINDFSPLSARTDTGALWENYLISERLKKMHFHLEYKNHYFWRTYDQQEIDLIEEENSQLNAFEFKWGNKNTRPPVAFTKAYPTATFTVIDKNNYLSFIS
ncbi:MAG: ATP-binding protein [Candidatus Marinimicrobia bacterium]|nr:ATP-binding protein [Candidatus Neomarinimicrobiota bacterium]